MQTSAIVLMVLGGLALYGCDVDQTREARAPDVDVEGGQLPAYDVDTPEVDVEQEKRQVTVPDVDVQTEERTVTVPEVDVEPPKE